MSWFFFVKAGQPEFTSEDQEEELTEVRPLDLLDLDSIEFHDVMTEATLPSSSQVPVKSHRTQLDDEEDQNVEDDERDEENDSVDDEEEEYLETTIQTSRKNAEVAPLKRDSSSSIIEQTTRGSLPSLSVTYERIPALQDVEDGGSGGVEGGGMTTPIPEDGDGVMSPGEVTPALSTMSRETSEIGRGLAELLSGPWAHNESQEADLSTDNIEEILNVDKKSNVPQKLVDAVDPRADEDLLELMVRIAESPNEWRHVHETLPIDLAKIPEPFSQCIEAYRLKNVPIKFLRCDPLFTIIALSPVVWGQYSTPLHTRLSIRLDLEDKRMTTANQGPAITVT
uniref:Uncharacterized protein n=1 Tax=Timema monikensis TaxID=170555 RepID=A0A7R9E274_9NEOP|nr:unnamed protein product [Timema monikensis]